MSINLLQNTDFKEVLNNGFYHELEKSPKKKGKCVACGHNNTFRYYEGLSRDFGRCDRESKCGYHNKPVSNGSREKVAAKPLETISRIVYPDNNLVLRTKNNSLSNLHTFLINARNMTVEYLEKWGLGTSIKNDSNTAFIYYNREERAVNIKTVEYDPKTGKRRGPFSSLAPREGERYSWCLFGSHLFTNRIVCLVESEKTALIASKEYPEFDWCATGSSNGLTVEKVKDILDKTVYYLPDADKAGRENSSIKRLQEYNINHFVIDLFPDRNDGHDLADELIEGRRPEIKPTEQNEVIEPRGSIYTSSFFDLWGLRNNSSEFLIPDLLPRVGIAMLLGEDGIGKSQIARQLSLSIAFRLSEFLELSLTAIHWRAAFLGTEDSREDFIKAAKKQVYGLGQYNNVTEENPNIDFIEGTNFEDYGQLLGELERLLLLNPYDIIIIDAFSDLFPLVNGEINSNTHARQLL